MMVEPGPPSPSSPGRRRWTPPALAVRPFRWYWLAQWPALLGLWMQVVALGYLVYQVTGSSTAVGIVAAADGLPAVVLSLAGGVLADRRPRRRILLVTQSLLGVSAGSLAVLVATGHATFGTILVVAVVFGATDAVDLPTRQALVGDLVGRDLVMSAVALSSMALSATRIVGPSLAGLLIATTGPALCFAVLGLAYAGPVAVLLLVVPDIPPRPRVAGSTAIGDVLQALGRVRSDPVIGGVITAISALSLLGVAYMPYLPVLARTQLHGDARTLGLLYSVGGVGGLVGGLLVATLRRAEGGRRLLIAGGVVYAVSLGTLSQSTSLWLSLPALVGISLAFVTVNTTLTTLLQTNADPALRGRLLGLYATILSGLTPLGTLLYGLAGRVLPLFDVIGTGGILVGLTVLAVAMRPAFDPIATPVGTEVSAEVDPAAPGDRRRAGDVAD